MPSFFRVSRCLSLTATTVTPTLDFIPEKLHQFIMPAVRRIYLNVDNENASTSASLTQKIMELESRNTHLEARISNNNRDMSTLMKRCESSMVAARVNAERERSTRLENERLKAELMNLKKNCDEAKVKYNNALNTLRCVFYNDASFLCY
jgi:chromosome segregation ATPase